MTGGWQPLSTVSPGVRQGAIGFECGDARTWSIAVPNKDLTGYTAEWLLGIPLASSLLGLSLMSYTAPNIAVKKSTTAGSLSILSVAGVFQLRFTLLRADTRTLSPGTYWQQAIVFDLSGNPVTVAEGQVNLMPSLLTLPGA